ncbi:MAG TPA: hypothetical protein GXZ23_00375 [Clostridiales bacterium]|nr:hypothetical protein [Clostridiales bacterium]
MSFLKKLKGKIWYGVGAIGLDLSYGMFYSYLAKYMTDILQLNNTFLLLLTPIARIWDAINDPMMGTIVDNTKTKMGKYRPWIIIGSCANAIVLSLAFTNPGIPLGSVWLYVFMAVMYVSWGMTNTMADIPYWSMVPSFTNDPDERSIIATVARTFSGIGQGIISIGAPILIPLLSKTLELDKNGNKVWDATGYSRLAIICSFFLVFFSVLSVANTKETQVVAPSEKFTFKQMFRTALNNDQLLIFMLFAMLSNTGFYMFSGVGAYFFDVAVRNPSAQSSFQIFQAVGSILGLLVIPIMMKFTTRRRTYQFSLTLALVSYIGMFISYQYLNSLILMNVFYLFSSIGTSSMFVSQTVFLADIVDYGEVKMGYRAESITFSMKGFLQKMAYTIQTIILFSGLGISNYNPDNKYTTLTAKTTTFMMLVVPIIFMALSIIVFSTKFKLHGEYMEEITAEVDKRKAERAATNN